MGFALRLSFSLVVVCALWLAAPAHAAVPPRTRS
jgi:hypothetical protein